jgi:hypothetical protein
VFDLQDAPCFPRFLWRVLLSVHFPSIACLGLRSSFGVWFNLTCITYGGGCEIRVAFRVCCLGPLQMDVLYYTCIQQYAIKTEWCSSLQTISPAIHEAAKAIDGISWPDPRPGPATGPGGWRPGLAGRLPGRLAATAASSSRTLFCFYRVPGTSIAFLRHLSDDLTGRVTMDYRPSWAPQSSSSLHWAPPLGIGASTPITP